MIVPISVFALLRNVPVTLTLYFIAVFTDFFDGYVARKQGLASSKGADLDGTIDLIFVAFGLWWIYLFVPELYVSYWPYLIIVLTSFVAFFLVSFVKLRRMAIPHFWLAKLAMALFATLLPVILLFGLQHWFIHVTWIVTVISRIEMAIYILLGRTDMDARGLF